jgi:hypothetical protein
VEHDAHTLLIHLGDEDGKGWTTIAVDRGTRQWAVAQDRAQSGTAKDATTSSTSPDGNPDSVGAGPRLAGEAARMYRDSVTEISRLAGV